MNAAQSRLQGIALRKQLPNFEELGNRFTVVSKLAITSLRIVFSAQRCQLSPSSGEVFRDDIRELCLISSACRELSILV
jgi:hypothetical protein